MFSKIDITKIETDIGLAHFSLKYERKFSNSFFTLILSLEIIIEQRNIVRNLITEEKNYL